MHQKTLPELLKDLPVKWEYPGVIPERIIRSIQFDSRKIQPGDLFVAISGGQTDGHNYIQAAVEQGAVAVVGASKGANSGIPYINVEDSREALAYLAAAFYDHPARQMTVIGVTGTDGKTTTSNMIFSILKAAGLQAGLISTVNAVIGDEIIDTGFHVTTPEAPDVQLYLSKMVEAGLSVVVLETTSHGLAQHRVTGCEYDIAVVTNITHEHLDYHGTYEAYRAAKASLFQSLELTALNKSGNYRLAVLNKDDQSYEFLDDTFKGKTITYALESSADMYAEQIKISPSGTDFIARGKELSINVHCNLPGRYNVSNCLAAMSAAAALGIDPMTSARGIAALSIVPGRMEWIDLGQVFTAVVDFAHTPNALKQTLETAREMTSGRLIAIFGSAGLRDRQKRRMMAEVSAGLADITILTAEDPRTESLDAILAQMADSAEAAGGVEGKTFHRIPDRGEAIRLGVHLAKPGDLVIACGKGHEQSMCFMTTEYLWDDRIAMRAALSELLKCPGPKMPDLPTSISKN